jgi:hypothetical protein
MPTLTGVARGDEGAGVEELVGGQGKANTMTATMPGKARGTATPQNAATRLWPSTMACSSMSSQ